MSKRRKRRKQKREKQASTRDRIMELQVGLKALGDHVDGLNHSVAAMRHAMGIAGTYLAAEDARHLRGMSGLPTKPQKQRAKK